MTVLEILETIVPTPSLIEACRGSRQRVSGWRLTTFPGSRASSPWWSLPTTSRSTLPSIGPRSGGSCSHRLSGVTVALVAEKVETHEEYEQARAEGFTLIQGYYFCRPVLLKNRQGSGQLALANRDPARPCDEDPIDMRKLSRLVKRDASLTYRLLRLINSPICAIRQEVRPSRRPDCRGRRRFRRMFTLAITSELNAGPASGVLRMAFVRGRFCELAAGLAGLDSTEQYLLGLLSLLPAMLRLPMEELAPALPLRDEIVQALRAPACPEETLLTGW